MSPGSVKENVDAAFRNTFSIIFGECNVALDDLQDYFWENHPRATTRRSSASDKEVVLSRPTYCEGAKVVSQEEIDFSKKFEPLDINEIKDIDSIIAAIHERIYYAGNKVFGTSEDYEEVDNCTNSFYAYDSHDITNSKYVGHCSYVGDESEYVFGSSWCTRSKHAIRIVGADMVTRAFETHLSAGSSDLFFCYNCNGCSNVMFSFNQKAKRNMIGNLELEKGRYIELRKKLAVECREYIERNKRFYSMFKLPKPEIMPKINAATGQRKEIGDLKKIDDAFRTTCRVIFGSEIGSVKECEHFLSEKISRQRSIETPFGGTAPTTDIFFYKDIGAHAGVNAFEAEELAKIHLDAKEMQSLEKLVASLPKIAFFSLDFKEGSTLNNMDTVIVYNSANTYRVVDATFAKDCAYCTMALHSEHVFGCYRTVHSKFCIKCHDCFYLSGCFEMDGCSNCTNSMFCHNCENLDNCMFCFNTKSKRYAIGNVEIGREMYVRIKKLVLEDVLKGIRCGKTGRSIYDVGYAGKRR
ncbi:MAG: hypothetical protein PHS02_00540 [Candidatus ainarchaeum sp.]|nr:hypothetical protein [Candidatus ainarchaeum sp.]